MGKCRPLSTALRGKAFPRLLTVVSLPRSLRQPCSKPGGAWLAGLALQRVDALTPLRLLVLNLRNTFGYFSLLCQRVHVPIERFGADGAFAQ